MASLCLLLTWKTIQKPLYVVQFKIFFVYFIILIFLSIICAAIVKYFFNRFTKKTTPKLPPGPFAIPFIGNLFWLYKTFPQIMAMAVNTLPPKYGPIYTLRVGSKPIILIASRRLAHQALIVKGAIFADRPPALASEKLLSCDQHNITSGSYGPIWLLFRRNLISTILHSSKIKSYADPRKWALKILINNLKYSQSNCPDGFQVMEPIRYAIFCLLICLCFGERLEQKQIKDIIEIQNRVLLSFNRCKIINLCPSIGNVLFHKRWKELLKVRNDQEKTLLPLIRARKSLQDKDIGDQPFVPYVDTLFGLTLPEQKRKLEEKEIVTLCSEFFTAGADTTVTALQWIMANLVKHQNIQDKLFREIERVVGDGEENLKEEDLARIPYLKAVILECLRHHAPGQFLVPHAMTEDVVLEGFLVPKNSTVTFMVGEIGRDPDVWEDPMDFKPERFLKGDGNVEAFDLTGSREIKMMPFGVGRRMCPAYNLAMFHLEYFVAHLVWHFKWFNSKGKEVDLTEKHVFTTLMENPLEVLISMRLH